jgi:hypothetical protein
MYYIVFRCTAQKSGPRKCDHRYTQDQAALGDAAEAWRSHSNAAQLVSIASAAEQQTS